jgi:hypothetical protein
MRRGRGRGALVALAVLALAGTAVDTTEASGPARRHVEQLSYHQALHGSADTMEHWIEAAITRCIQDARTSDVPRTADAIERELTNIRTRCMSQVVAPDRD